MINLILGVLKGLCCVVGTGVQIKSATNNSLCCLPVKCAVELKDCYDQCTAEVTPETEVEMAGAPSVESMAS